jgi:hypothetical protein
MSRKKRSQNRARVTEITRIISRCLESWQATARLCLVLMCLIFATSITLTALADLHPIPVMHPALDQTISSGSYSHHRMG